MKMYAGSTKKSHVNEVDSYLAKYISFMFNVYQIIQLNMLH